MKMFAAGPAKAGHYVLLAGVLTLAVASTACFGLDNLFNSPTSSTDSSSTSVRSYLGTWTGPALTSFPTVQSCGNVEWKITSQTGTQISGDFTASCSGGITLAGTIVATVGDSTTIPWAASGTATQGSATCPFNLTGTGTFQGTSNIVVNYAGTSCFGPVSGSETIKRS
jgi:hypothetical protein